MVEIDRVQSPQDFVDLRKVLDPLDDTRSIYRAIHYSVVIYQGKVNGEVVCVWGLVPPTIMSTQAYIWLQTTPLADDHAFILVRYSQLMVQEMLTEYDALVGHCRIGDDRAVRWMRWLGAEFGPYQSQLIPFIIRRKNG